MINELLNSWERRSHCENNFGNAVPRRLIKKQLNCQLATFQLTFDHYCILQLSFTYLLPDFVIGDRDFIGEIFDTKTSIEGCYKMHVLKSEQQLKNCLDVKLLELVTLRLLKSQGIDRIGELIRQQLYCDSFGVIINHFLIGN